MTPPWQRHAASDPGRLPRTVRAQPRSVQRPPHPLLPSRGAAMQVVLPAGGVVFFCYGTPHATGPNRTERERAGVALHFLRADYAQDEASSSRTATIVRISPAPGRRAACANMARRSPARGRGDRARSRRRGMREDGASRSHAPSPSRHLCVSEPWSMRKVDEENALPGFLALPCHCLSRWLRQGLTTLLLLLRHSIPRNVCASRRRGASNRGMRSWEWGARASTAPIRCG